jgi:hypothetical protein
VNTSTTSQTHLTADDVMSAREVADLVHMPISTVQDYGRRGILPSVKIGRHRLYIRSRIEAMLLGDGALNAHCLVSTSGIHGAWRAQTDAQRHLKHVN